jgi:hypothetical protein
VGNARIRSLNLTTGTFNTAVGGASANYGNSRWPTEYYVQPIGLNAHGGNLYFTDSTICTVGVWNRGTTSLTTNGVTVPAGKVSSLLGNSIGGCENWWTGGTKEGAVAQGTRVSTAQDTLKLSDGSLLVSFYDNACILKISNTGLVSQWLGLCSTSATVDGNVPDTTTVRLRNMRMMAEDPIVPGNFFVVTNSILSPAYVKYVNLSASAVTIAGVSVPAGQIKIVLSGIYSNGVAARENQICYANGYLGQAYLGPHSVICVDRTSGSVTLQVGPTGSTGAGGYPWIIDDHEGDPVANAKMTSPIGMTFDSNGNLYIADSSNQRVIMVKKWW